EKNRKTTAARREAHPGIGLVPRSLKTERPLDETREELWLSLRERGRNLMVRQNTLWGLYPRKNAKAHDGEEWRATPSTAENKAFNRSLRLRRNVGARDHERTLLRQKAE
ncbi:MAG: hypothetical protein WAO35_12370, partial [Terriglobia bacterium]